MHNTESKKHMLDLVTILQEDWAICTLLQKIEKIIQHSS